jgi:NAD(P)-dependent dehydrogenase (short-subunit alcohol dehydrogenase family)
MTDSKTAVITGATGGIGRWIADGLARAGYAVTVIARDARRAAAAQAWITARTPRAEIDIRLADLSLLSETRAVGAAILQDRPRIDLLVNNAGALLPMREITAEGHERTLATNLLSPMALTEVLLPALEAAEAARIVMIGSSSSDRARIDPDNLELSHDWKMVRAYSQSKLALLMVSLALAERLRSPGVTVNVVHPGLVATEIVRHGGIVGLAWKLMAPFSLTPEKGADTPLYACLAPELAGKTGLYLKRRQRARPNPLVQDAALVTRVEAATQRLLA